MTQAERDRLVALKKAKKKLITQKQAAEELGITERHVRRLLRGLKRRGDKAVSHALRGLPSKPRDQRRHQTRGGDDPGEAGIRGIQADAGLGISGETPRYSCQPGNGAAMDDRGQTMARTETACGEDP